MGTKLGETWINATLCVNQPIKTDTPNSVEAIAHPIISERAIGFSL